MLRAHGVLPEAVRRSESCGLPQAVRCSESCGLRPQGVLRSQIELMQIFKGIMPYLGIVIFSMFLMYMFPGIALWLPDALFGPYVP